MSSNIIIRDRSRKNIYYSFYCNRV